MSERCRVCKEGTLVYYWNEKACLRLVCLRCRTIFNPAYEVIARPPVAAKTER